MILDRIFLAVTLLIILVNVVGWEGIRLHFKIARGLDTEERHWRFLHGAIPWLVRMEFIYYLGLMAFVLERPGIFPLALIVYLVLYHTAGFILNEALENRARRSSGTTSVASSSSTTLWVLRAISFLDGIEMAILCYFCLVLVRWIP